MLMMWMKNAECGMHSEYKGMHYIEKKKLRKTKSKEKCSNYIYKAEERTTVWESHFSTFRKYNKAQCDLVTLCFFPISAYISCICFRIQRYLRALHNFECFILIFNPGKTKGFIKLTSEGNDFIISINVPKQYNHNDSLGGGV